MDQITKEYIEQQAPDLSTIKNGMSLSSKGNFNAHGRNEEDNLYFAQCKGSGKNPYYVSADFIVENQPVFRCSCPSRKLPCKHSIGLLQEIVNNAVFPITDAPTDVLDKRKKQQTRVEKAITKGDEPVAPKKVSKTARIKKMKKQLEGLEVAEKLVSEILNKGVATIDLQTATTYEKIAKELGNYYLSGPQNYIYELIDAIENLKYARTQGSTMDYNAPLSILIKLNALVKKSKSYLNKRVESEEFENEDNELYESLGGAWKLEELNALGLGKEKAELLQLSFYITESNGAKQFVDTGYWMDLETGKINPTYNYRPYKAVNHIKQDDSVFEIIIPEILTHYPGAQNERIRWNSFQTRGITDGDIKKCKNFATDIGIAVKSAKSYLKNTLAKDSFPVCIAYETIGYSKEGSPVLVDHNGVQLSIIPFMEDGISLHNLRNLPDVSLYENQVIFGEIVYDETEKCMGISPLSIISDHAVIRLCY